MALRGGNTQEGERGPGWYDVNRFLRAMEKQYGVRVGLVVEPSGVGGKDWGLRVTAAMANIPGVQGCGSYGPAHPGNGQKTLAAAAYHALLRLDIEVSKYWLKAPELLQNPLEGGWLDDVSPSEG